MINHLALILDGNRRFAKRLMKQPWKGHEWGAQKVQKVMGWSRELGIKELTMYAFSLQNFNRPKIEFKYLMDLFRKEWDDLGQPEKLQELKDEGIQINFLGRIHLFPKDVQDKMNKLMENTKNNSKFKVNFAMAYGGQEEILDAIGAMADKIKNGTIQEVTKELFEKHLYTASEPDLIIRTGGDKRTSNFMNWQSWYSEWLFMDKFWPEFEKIDLVNAVDDYNSRNRRFGK